MFSTRRILLAAALFSAANSFSQSINSWQSLAGSEHSMLLSKSGHIWTCGAGNSGQLGNGTHGDDYSYDVPDVSTSTFAEIDPTHAYIYIWAADKMSAALRTDSTLWVWGGNLNGRLGLPNVSIYGTVDVPTQVGTAKWKKIAGSSSTIIGIQADGSLWTWGDNDNSMTGLDTYANLESQMSPKRLDRGKWIDCASAWYHSAAVNSDGTLWEWGLNKFTAYNPFNIIDDGPDTTYVHPVQVGRDKDWIHVQVGCGFTVAMKKDGSLWTWGRNDEGQLGQGLDPSLNNSNITPTKVLDDVKSYSVGDKHVVAIKNDGTLWGWGYDLHGELGDGAKFRRWIGPKQLGTAKWLQIEAGAFYTIGLQEDGTVWSAGFNRSGQLGLGSTSNVTTFTKVDVSADDVVKPDTTQKDTTVTDTVVTYTAEDIAAEEGNILQADSTALLYASFAGGKDMDASAVADAYGVYRFYTESKPTFEAVKTGADYQWASSAFVNGTVYAHRTEQEGALAVSFLDAYDASTWERLSSTPIPTVTKLAGATSFNPKDNKLYGFFQNEWFDTNTEFAVLHTDKDSVELLHSFVNDNNVFSAFAVNKDGEMYAINGAGNLYTIDTKGNAKEIGFTGINPRYSSSMTFDYRTGRLYWYAVDLNNQMGLYEINVKSGKAHKITDGDVNRQFVALYAENPVYGTPDWVTNISFISLSDDKTVGTLSFKLPVKTIDNKALTGSVSVAISTDGGETITLDNQNPGDVVSQQISVDKKLGGRISIVVSNNIGKGLIARVKPNFSITNGITAVNANNGLSEEAPLYNLSGQKVGKNYHGIVIQNGHKFFNK